MGKERKLVLWLTGLAERSTYTNRKFQQVGALS